MVRVQKFLILQEQRRYRPKFTVRTSPPKECGRMQKDRILRFPGGKPYPKTRDMTKNRWLPAFRYLFISKAWQLAPNSGDRSPQFPASNAYFGFSRSFPWKEKSIIKNGKNSSDLDVNINIGHTPMWMTYIGQAAQPIREQLCGKPANQRSSSNSVVKISK